MVARESFGKLKRDSIYLVAAILVAKQALFHCESYYQGANCADELATSWPLSTLLLLSIGVAGIFRIALNGREYTDSATRHV